ncbi:hypothetical protein AAFF_G00352910 [Aldrovandia affinis]|uniref:Uncharacterized protein n=1 Tax=Aldrovandia affinis TaxID=143900 RepID=A0AAD7SJ06_9TELE|nr:hypothetical protein AAFF_G00352910 [Aldrovandia affinis]
MSKGNYICLWTTRKNEGHFSTVIPIRQVRKMLQDCKGVILGVATEPATRDVGRTPKLISRTDNPLHHHIGAICTTNLPQRMGWEGMLFPKQLVSMTQRKEERSQVELHIWIS